MRSERVGPALVAIFTVALAGACTATVEPTAAPARSTATSLAPSSASVPATSPAPSISTTTTSPAPLPPSMKGWELYSWPVNGEWHYTLAVGTNRAKTFEEITARSSSQGVPGMVDVAGVDALGGILGRLPAGQDVLWMGASSERMPGISLPPADVVDAVQRRAAELHVQVLVAHTP